jgi:hypothetical protein
MLMELEAIERCEHGNINCEVAVLRPYKIEINGEVFLEADDVPTRCSGGRRIPVTLDYRTALIFARTELQLNIYLGELTSIVDAALIVDS